MARKRSPEHDYICMKCMCPCDHERHLGGGQNMRACSGPVHPILRSEWDAMIARDVEAVKYAIGYMNRKDSK